MLRLLALAAGLVLLGLLALLVLARRGAPLRLPANEVLAAELEVPETEQPLESLDEDSDLRRESRPDAPPRVYGRLLLAGEPALAQGGKVRVLFEDHHASPFSAEDAHARLEDDDARLRSYQSRVASVRRDGWWYVDLPGRCWVVQAEFVPSVRTPEMPPVLAAALLDDPALANERPQRNGKQQRRFLAQREAIPSFQRIEKPVERGKLEVTLTVEPGLVAQGVVLDARTQAPVVGAQVALKNMKSPRLVCQTQADGSFRMTGIDPRDLRPVDGTVGFVVQSPQHTTALRETPWEEGQQGIVAFRVFLEPKGR